MTAVAASLLEPIPAHATFGLRVEHAADASGEVSLEVTPGIANVVGSLHSSGLVALIDATGLAAIIAAAETPHEFRDVTPLGVVAQVEFLALARGRLKGHCRLGDEARERVRDVLERRVRKATLFTDVEIVDDSGATVCRGRFTWKLRCATQQPSPAP